jgi:hypothetical protein
VARIWLHQARKAEAAHMCVRARGFLLFVDRGQLIPRRLKVSILSIMAKKRVKNRSVIIKLMAETKIELN